MKNIFLIILAFISVKAFSQITVDFQTPMRAPTVVKLNDSKTKYLDSYIWWEISQDQFSLYNLDGSLYKTITMIPRPIPSAVYTNFSNISESLFDNDPTTIEYIVCYKYDSIPGKSFQRTRIIREDGTILLDELNAQDPFLFSTEEGSKLMLSYYITNGVFNYTKVFSLPGQLPTNSSTEIEKSQSKPILYPNPNSGFFSVKIQNMKNEVSTIDLLSPSGNLIKTYHCTGNQININEPGLQDGLYFINATQLNQNSSIKMVIIK